MSLLDNYIQEKIQNERWFIGTVMAKEEEAFAEYGHLKPEAFIDSTAREFWKRFLENNGDAKKAAATSSDLLKDLTHFSYFEVPTYDLALYAGKMQELGWAIETMESINRLAKCLNEKDLVGANQILSSIKDLESAQKTNYKTADEVARSFTDFISSLGTQKTGYSTGIPKIDIAIGRLQPQWVSVLASRTNIGKTALALQFAFNVANQGGKVLYFSTESRAMDLWMRRVLGIVGVAWRDLINGNVTDDQKTLLDYESLTLAEKYKDTLIIDDTSRKLSEIRASVAKLRPDFIVIDHLDEIQKPYSQSKVEFLGEVMDEAKSIAKTYNTHVLCVHQLNRGLEERQEKRPELRDLRWSGDIEQKADIVCMLYREDIYADASIRAGEVEVEFWTRKHRMAKRDTVVMLDYDLQKQWYRDRII